MNSLWLLANMSLNPLVLFLLGDLWVSVQQDLRMFGIRIFTDVIKARIWTSHIREDPKSICILMRQKGRQTVPQEAM